MKIVGDYVLLNIVLGKGQFGEVRLAKYNNKSDKAGSDKLRTDSTALSQMKKEYLACKIIKKDNLTPQLLNNLKSEIGILTRIQSPNVIGFYDVQKTANNFYLMMQYCNGGDLEELRKVRKSFREQEARYFLSQIVKGFKAMYDMKVLHRDVKLANILIHFRDADQKIVMNKRKWDEFKKTAPLIG